MNDEIQKGKEERIRSSIEECRVFRMRQDECKRLEGTSSEVKTHG